MQNGIDGKRNLLAEEMLRYFGETCPALAARCEIAIVGLPPLVRREVAGRLQTLRRSPTRPTGSLRPLASQSPGGRRRLSSCSIAHSHQSSISARSPRL